MGEGEGGVARALFRRQTSDLYGARALASLDTRQTGTNTCLPARRQRIVRPHSLAAIGGSSRQNTFFSSLSLAPEDSSVTCPRTLQAQCSPHTRASSSARSKPGRRVQIARHGRNSWSKHGGRPRGCELRLRFSMPVREPPSSTLMITRPSGGAAGAERARAGRLAFDRSHYMVKKTERQRRRVAPPCAAIKFCIGAKDDSRRPRF